MDKPRVFISHSTGKDPDARKVLDALSEGLEGEFAVRVDKDHLKLGVYWRNTLNTWIGGCDAAVLLLSTDALASQFVAYEASILTFRHHAHNFTLVPVYMSGIHYADVKGSRTLSPTNIQEVQAVKTTDTAQIIAEVKERLREVTRGKTPIDRQVRRLEELLEPVGKSLIIDDYLPMLGYTTDPWEREDNPHRLLAVHMMSAGIKGAWEVLRNIRSTLKRNETLNEVFELVATSWVDVQATKHIAEVVTGEQARRALAINGETDLIAKMYLRRASGLEDGWKVAEPDGVVGEDALEGLKTKVDEELRLTLGISESADLEGELEEYEGLGEPVVVMLLAAGIGPDELAGLREAFKTVTFMFLAGTDPLCHTVLTGSEVEFIIPQLGEGFEKDFCKFYKTSKKILIEKA
ncbi:MAG TPA: toll/interleukin-1 receptor domain-containing protein [Pyrinomonadaceae bacterium]|nr:toll/interleukin-1 receptor domain-containing protein [Pyrinomonadaceae bacterium]